MPIPLNAVPAAGLYVTFRHLGATLIATLFDAKSNKVGEIPDVPPYLKASDGTLKEFVDEVAARYSVMAIPREDAGWTFDFHKYQKY